MNIFYLEINNKKVLIGSSIELNQDSIIKKNNEDVLFINDDKVVGFNINNFENNTNLKPGRIFLDEKLLNIINNHFSNTNIKKNNYFKVGKVIECEKIEGTHLSLTKVDIGSEVLQIVCGASNVRKDICVIVATIGAIMNNGLKIVKGNLRGNESFGMICSKKELGINDEKINDDGIIELDNKDYKVGDDFKLVYSY